LAGIPHIKAMNDKDKTFNLGVGGKPLLSFSIR